MWMERLHWSGPQIAEPLQAPPQFIGNINLWTKIQRPRPTATHPLLVPSVFRCDMLQRTTIIEYGEMMYRFKSQLEMDENPPALC